MRLILAALILGSNAPPPPKPVVPWILLTQCNINSDNLPHRGVEVV